MVIAEKWAEQRVMMRAYAESRDQTLPTIMLHGIELAIGPAGVDVNGPWGIHVDGDSGRAQEVRTQLEGAAKRLAGSKGNPPRLADEEDTFNREPTANWGPGAPRILPKRTPVSTPEVDFVDQQAASAARVPQVPGALPIDAPAAQHYASSSPTQAELRKTPLGRSRRKTTVAPPMSPAASQNARTALGYQFGAGAQSAVVRLGLSAQVSSRLGRLVDRVVPAEFHIDGRERRVLNLLGEATGSVSARAIGQIIDSTDAMAFMDELVEKLEKYGLDLVEPGDFRDGEPTYRLRR
ncbi:MAG: hypothetical protein NT062_22155 [Proteobacteria bacterium]|nr:hypothetical protein [Pseudomonadota bacterium]